jgi:hypothetical protein
MKFNPFRPNSLATVGMFEGRMEETRALDSMLHNTLNQNPQHFLVHGERGIGKSSLLYVEEKTAQGKIPTFDGTRFNFLVVSINLDSTDSYSIVVEKLARELRTTCERASEGKAFLTKAWDVLKRFEAAGVKLRDKAITSTQTPLMELTDAYSEVCNEIAGFYDGVLILIDEADKAPANANLGSILKTLTERVSRSDNNVLSIGLAGTSALISILRESHESSPRLFRHFELKALEDVEVAAVVDAAIKEANDKGDKLSINADAKEHLVKLSEGYPSFIQEFGYAAVQADTDGVITLEDVEVGAWAEHGAFTQLGEKYFKHLYLGKIASQSYRKLLQTMAAHDDDWVTKEQLRKEAGLSEGILTNALQALLNRKIILSREGRKGFYRLPSKSFAAWLRAYQQRTNDSGNIATDVLDMVLFSSEPETNN